MEHVKSITSHLKCANQIIQIAQGIDNAQHVTALCESLALVVAELSQTQAKSNPTPHSKESSIVNLTEDKYAFQIPNISCLSPRGRHTFKINPTELCLSAKKGDVVISLTNIQKSYCLNKVDNYGKISACLWLLVLDTAVPVGKQTTKTIVFSTSPKPVQGIVKKGKALPIIEVNVTNKEHLPSNVSSEFNSFKGTYKSDAGAM